MNINEEYKKFIDNFSRFMSKDIYITNKMYSTYLNKYKYLTQNIHHDNIYYKQIKQIITNKKNFIKKHNLNFINKKLKEYDKYFDEMFANIDKNIKLDINQKKAILTQDDNILVIAGAGSGKTTTMAAKVKYLIDKCNYKQSEIAVISFTNKACDEIREKVHEKFGFNNVDIYTFHKLGLKILREANNQNINIIDDGGKYKIFINYIKNNLFNNKDKFDDFYNVFNYILKIDKDYKTFKNFKEYHDYLYKRKYTTNKTELKTYLQTQINKRKEYYKTIKGEKVKSKEEVEIANFLYLNSIDYEYEKKVSNKNYKPDFYIYENELFNYIEHFGVDKTNNNSSFTEKELTTYLSNMKLKRDYHKSLKLKDLFIISYSNKDKKQMLNNLYQEIKKRGYSFKKKEYDEIYEMLKNTSEDIYFIDFINKLLIPFISYFKSSYRQKEDFNELLNETNNSNLKLQLKVIEDFYTYYENELRKNNLIDFDDMINYAYSDIDKVKEKNLGVDYKYIIIDEYQDISVQKYNLTAKIAKLFNAKIFAVGDDYQTIFSFAGARIDLLTDFKKYMKDASIIPIENTYRNSQELLDIANSFITKNKLQIEKKLKSNKHLDKPVEIYTYDNTIEDKNKKMSDIISNIYNAKPNDKILLLTRYNKDIKPLIESKYFTKKNKEKIICNSCPNADITYLTIHSSKGLGYDQCILINAVDDKFGFPSKIEDSPLIKLIKPTNKENILFPEERRLFYVALTRTKNKLYIVCPKLQASSFVKEIVNDKNVLIHK